MHSKTKHMLIFFLICCAAIALSIKLKLFSPSTSLLDFEAYIHLVLAARNAQDPYTVNAMQTLGPPVVLLPFYPFSFFPLQTAKNIWTALGLSCLAGSTFYLYTKTGKKNPFFFFIFSVLSMFSFPVRFCLEMGQSGLLLLPFIAFLIFGKKHGLGMITAILVIIKSIFVFPLILLNSKKGILSLGVFLSFFVLISILLFPKTTWTTYLQRLPSRIESRHIPVGSDYYNQSLRSTLYRIHIEAYYPIVFFFLVLLAYETTRKTKDVRVALVWPLLLSPVSWQHYYAILLPISLSMLFPLSLKKGMFWIFWYIWWGLQFPVFHTQSGSVLFGLGASHFFISAVLLLVWLLKNAKAASHTN